MESETCRTIRRHKQEDENWRRRCGCIRTSDKLRQILDKFPAPPPPTPENKIRSNPTGKSCICAICTVHQSSLSKKTEEIGCGQLEELKEEGPKQVNKSWRVLTEVVQLVQVSVTATALALYYIIFCYMQLIYYSLRSVLYFHNADGPMKITIAVVTITSLIVAINVLTKIEKLMRIF